MILLILIWRREEEKGGGGLSSVGRQVGGGGGGLVGALFWGRALNNDSAKRWIYVYVYIQKVGWKVTLHVPPISIREERKRNPNSLKTPLLFGSKFEVFVFFWKGFRVIKCVEARIWVFVYWGFPFWSPPSFSFLLLNGIGFGPSFNPIWSIHSFKLFLFHFFIPFSIFLLLSYTLPNTTLPFLFNLNACPINPSHHLLIFPF